MQGIIDTTTHISSYLNTKTSRAYDCNSSSYLNTKTSRTYDCNTVQ